MKQLSFKQLFSTLFLAGFLFLFTNCSVDENANSKKDSITKLVNENENLSILKQALVKTDLANTLQSEGDYTFFAPSNSAFESFLIANGFANIDAVPTPILKEILLNHLLDIRYTVLTLPVNGYATTNAKDTSGTNFLSLYVRKSGSQTRLNGISDIINGNILAENGILHIIDGVLTLPSITSHLSANPNLSSFTAALAFNSSSNFFPNLSGSLNAPFTVFAPTNGAFTAFFVEKSFTQLSDINADVLEKTLKYHITYADAIQANELMNNQTITTSTGENLTVVFSNGTIKVKDVNNRLATLLITDVQCSNGVIHITDKVVFPSF